MHARMGYLRSSLAIMNTLIVAHAACILQIYAILACHEVYIYDYGY